MGEINVKRAELGMLLRFAIKLAAYISIGLYTNYILKRKMNRLTKSLEYFPF